MPRVFADAAHYIAILIPSDSLHHRALAVANGPGDIEIITTDAVLVEVLAFVAELGRHVRERGVALIDRVMSDDRIAVIPQTHELFLRALDLYRQRLDKGYSLMDCMSMVPCADRDITDVLSRDHHFEQEGLTILL
jgi:predicted nucleic acid-binding protein